jgi:hypothetical protein
MVFLVPFLALTASAGAGELHLYVNSRSFDVSVAPVDEASRNAQEAVLYQRAAVNEEWKSLGPCTRDVLPGGDVRFTREVDVDRDGIFLYTSRPVVGGEVSLPPGAGDAAQATVVVDTLPPTVEILLPPEGVEVGAGDAVVISWVISDEYLPDEPGTLGYSTDGGRSWNLVKRGLSAEGEWRWTTPADLAGPAVLRLTATDRAGNVGRAVRAVELTPPAVTELRRIPEDAPVSPEPGELAQIPREPETVHGVERDPNSSWLYYLMALNQMRQNKPAEALQYYWLSVKADPEFINAWADLALAYNDLGADRTARDVIEQTRERAPGRVDLVHLLGETFHAEGMEMLRSARDTEERMRAKGLIDQAVGWYGRALELAADDWRLTERAPTFYRLGEICYYVNLDRDGARAYWEKILKLHEPAPNSDLLKWSRSPDKGLEKRRFERNTHRWVALQTWQNWARGYLAQLDARERAGILDLLAAGRSALDACPAPAPSLSYAGNAMNPGRDDGRSLFSLPAQLGSPGGVGIASATSYSADCGDWAGGGMSMAAHLNQPPVADGYSFYAEKDRPEPPRPVKRGRKTASMFSGREVPPPANPDPYAFPTGNRGGAAWNQAQPYGNTPSAGW